MLTVHFLDEGHLLVTHSLRALVPRRPEAEAGSDDGRLVGAEIVALPSGKVLGRTVWHTHDHGRYLWSLGKGRFLLRIGRELSVLAPLARLNTKDPFERLRFPDRGGLPAAVLLSADGELLTVETQIRERKQTRLVLAPTQENRDEERRSREVVVDFYRLSGEGSDPSPLRIAAAGTVRAPEPIALPIDGDGYLWIGESRRGQWPVTFHEFGGKAETIAPVLSSCVPRLQLVSRSQFLAFTCQGSEDRLKLEAFGFDGHENWEESLAASLAPASFAFAPEAGRFAMSRVVTSYVANEPAAAASSLNLQEVRVYQTESGDLLLKTQASPPLKVAENFDLSADGRFLAVARGTSLDIFELPKASSRDQKELADARQFAPPRGEGPVRLGVFAAGEKSSDRKSVATQGEVPAEAPVQAGGQPAVGAAVATSPARTGTGGASETTTPVPATSGQTDAAGDAPPERRRPPTLLNPGEKPESGKPKS